MKSPCLVTPAIQNAMLAVSGFYYFFAYQEKVRFKKSRLRKSLSGLEIARAARSPFFLILRAANKVFFNSELTQKTRETTFSDTFICILLVLYIIKNMRYLISIKKFYIKKSLVSARPPSPPAKVGHRTKLTLRPPLLFVIHSNHHCVFVLCY